MSDQQRGFWEELGAKRFAPGKGVAEPPPQGGWRRFFFVLGAHFWKLISLNLLFLVFSIPLITIPAALCGINRVLIKLYRDGNCFVWDAFYKEFRANLWKALPFGCIGAFSLFASYYFLSLGTSVSQNGVDVITTALGILLLVFAVLFLSYVFAFLPVLDLKNKQITRNALIFLLMEWKANLAILSIVTITAVFSFAFFPLSLFTLALSSVSFMQYVICVAVNSPLEKRIIKPFEESKATSKE